MKTVKLKSGNLEIEYEVILRPGIKEFLEILRSLFCIVLLSHEDEDNIDALLDVIEEDDSYFDFTFGKDHLLNKKYKMRNPYLLNCIGSDKGRYIMIGADYDDFKGFENVALPISRYNGSKCDNALEQL